MFNRGGVVVVLIPEQLQQAIEGVIASHMGAGGSGSRLRCGCLISSGDE
jgi:hypothetical protein